MFTRDYILVLLLSRDFSGVIVFFVPGVFFWCSRVVFVCWCGCFLLMFFLFVFMVLLLSRELFLVSVCFWCVSFSRALFFFWCCVCFVVFWLF